MFSSASKDEYRSVFCSLKCYFQSLLLLNGFFAGIGFDFPSERN